MHFFIGFCIAFLIFTEIVCFNNEVNDESNDYEDQYNNHILGLRTTPKRSKKLKFANHTNFFSPLDGYHVNAKPALEADYPYIAEVIHSHTYDYPHVCTATCISERIFVTCARCLYNLKLYYTRVKYQQHKFLTRAFVVPSYPTKQMYDDIGLVVSEPTGFKKPWVTIKIYNKARTDDNFKWFDGLMTAEDPMSHRVIGYALEKLTHKLRVPSSEFKLKTVDVVLGKEMCHHIFTLDQFDAFHVPCFHSCKFEEFKVFDKKCSKYLGEEGAPVINTHTNTLIGVSTWGAPYTKYELPVGFSVPNSDNFRKDYECAIRIRDDTTPVASVTTGYYQSVCHKLR